MIDWFCVWFSRITICSIVSNSIADFIYTSTHHEISQLDRIIAYSTVHSFHSSQVSHIDDESISFVVTSQVNDICFFVVAGKKMDSPLRLATISTALVSKFYQSQCGHDDVLHITKLSLDAFLENLRIRYKLIILLLLVFYWLIFCLDY